MRSAVIVTGFVASLVITACGSGGARQDATEPKGKFPVTVDAASFPVAQTLSQHSHLTIAIRNSGSKTIPDVAVTICNVSCAYPASTAQGTSAQAFSQDLNAKYLANPSRPIWVVDQGPGACRYSCQNGGQGAAVTAYSNTWALGKLAPGKTVRFDWKVTAVSPGRHVVAWEIAAGLNGRARAVLSNGSLPHGAFAVNIASKPARNYVNNSGQIVSGSGQP
ncbi:MAG: hypothetical protein QOF83_3097 [Solirubrobacteraceae bacterium]|jgi:hypothetical protein|nr:hypothetical protein [Solirubrobacteraceae bacterium]